MDSDYNNDTAMSSVSPNDRKHRRLASSSNMLFKIAFKESGITLKESILLSYDKMAFHLNAGTTKDSPHENYHVKSGTSNITNDS